jgi:hypothetical protein
MEMYNPLQRIVNVVMVVIPKPVIAGENDMI